MCLTISSRQRTNGIIIKNDIIFYSILIPAKTKIEKNNTNSKLQKVSMLSEHFLNYKFRNITIPKIIQPALLMNMKNFIMSAIFKKYEQMLLFFIYIFGFPFN